MNDVDSPVISYDWKKFVSLNFRQLKGIKNYHCFRIEAKLPGIVFVREYSTEEEPPLNLVKNNSVDIPTVNTERIVPKGLDSARQWYLYQEIRPFVHNCKDIVFKAYGSKIRGASF